jgi:uncharacterized protein YndB with AHSA1/START domain
MRSIFLIGGLLAAFATPSFADVMDSASNGFTVRSSVSIAATREQVYRAAVQQVGDWWNDDHTVSGDATNMRIDARPLGCFCEDLGEGAGLAHMTVTFVNPLVMIRFNGGLGPLGLMGTDGNMTWEFEDEAGGTKVTLNYAVGGYLAGGLDAIAPAVDGVLSEQLAFLKAFLESRSSGD